ncbi:protein FAM53C [Lepisosteus oculatus]|uniref:protein FAM53C n=1 Tax=Lepisosteus oculatus TaxID=7918 RepID=UPI0035F52369
MVTLITKQLQKQSLDDHTYHRAFTLNLSVPEPPGHAGCWTTYGLTPETSCWRLCSPGPGLQDSSALAGAAHGAPPVGGGEATQQLLVPSTSVTDLSCPGAPPAPPPPPKRHCRSLSVPEDLSRCRAPWRPSGSKIWTPVKRRCHSGGGAGGSCPLQGPQRPQRAPSSSLPSPSSPTFFSLALSPDSPLHWSFPWEAGAEAGGGGCFFPSPPSSSSSPLFCAPPPPLSQRRFSLSPVHIQEAAARFLPPPPGPPSPSSACSTPSCSRRAPPPAGALPRSQSQPCDLHLRKPGIKRRRDPEGPHCARPGLDFGKMAQTRSSDPLCCGDWGSGACRGGGMCLGQEPGLGCLLGSHSPPEGLGVSIGPLSESEEEEEEDDDDSKSDSEEQQGVFERDCTELDLTLIEEN